MLKLKYVGIVLLGGALCLYPASIWAWQDAEEPAAEDTASASESEPTDSEDAEADSAAPAEAASEGDDFATLFGQWKELLTDLRALQDEYKIARPDERPALVDQFNQLVAQGDELAPRLRAAAEAAYVANPEGDMDVAGFLVSVVVTGLERGDAAEALRVAELLIAHDFSNKSIFNEAGIAAFQAGEGAKALEFFQKAEEANVLDPQGKKHQREQQARNREAEADDLPRVLLKTSKGDITLELFENEAPNTVANFISLVESGFYNELTFHRVLEGFMAQGGCPTGDGTGGPGYNIACECYDENHREHFEGSLSMAHAGRNTGGSQFFITFGPTPHLDGKHTVFGRVVEGMDVVDSLQLRDPMAAAPAEPDTITEATVIRKRDHEYQPEKVGDSPG